MSYRRICPRCDSEYETDNYRQKYCRKNCTRPSEGANRARNTVVLNNDYKFIAVDGEGVDRPNGEHDYIMLSVGDATLTNSDGSALHHSQIFQFLYDQYQAYPGAVFVGFALGYDFAMWTKTFTAHEGRMLYTRHGIELRRRMVNPEPYPVYVDSKWEVDILGSKRFRLCPHIHRGPTGTDDSRAYDMCVCGVPIPYPNMDDDLPIGDEIDVTKRNAWANFLTPKRERMYVCDTFGFWQSSFLAAIDPAKWHGDNIVTKDEYAVLMEGKSKRSSYIVPYGETGYLTEMAEYNRTENAVLSRITATIARGLAEIGISLNRKDWYGPGRAAQGWLNLLGSHTVIDMDIHCNTLTREYHQTLLKEWQYEIGWKTYYGGRFEQFCHGHIPTDIWEYDINSAYPAVIANLPCLLHGRWSRGTDMVYRELDDTGVTAVYGTIIGSNPYLGGLPHRTRTGAIVFPHATKGWYWKREIDAAIAAGLVDSVETHEWINYVPCECNSPLEAIRDLYLARINPNVGKNSPRGKSLKLVYNSTYGKFAQSIGHPRYGNGIYASLITSGCRTQIIEAIGAHPRGPSAVTMIATDGVYFTSPHPNLNLTTNKLGAWEETRLTGMTQFMPGVYWTDESRERIANGRTLKFKSRGISARDLAQSIHTLDDAFHQFADDLTEWPRLDLNVQFSIISPRQALQRNDWGTAGKIEHNTVRVIDSRPVHKRDASRVYRDGYLIRTPIGQPDNPETYPYDKRFGYDNGDMQSLRDTLGWGIVPDGDITDLFWESLNG